MACLSRSLVIPGRDPCQQLAIDSGGRLIDLDLGFVRDLRQAGSHSEGENGQGEGAGQSNLRQFAAGNQAIGAAQLGNQQQAD